MKKNPKKPTSIYLSDEQEKFLVSHPLGRTEVIKNALDLFSEIDWETIKGLAKNYQCHPGLLVDIAVQYFSKLDEVDRLQKFLEYWQARRKEAEAREEDDEEKKE